MEKNQSFRQFSDQLRLQASSFSNLCISDSIWSTTSSGKKCEERRNFDVRVGGGEGGFKQNGFNTGSGRDFNKGSCLSNTSFISKTSERKSNTTSGSSKRLIKTSLPPTECLSRGEVIGGYIFVCNNETMQQNLQMQLFGLPPRYRDSVRAIMPGLPLFLYNYSNHQLHGVFQASSFGGSNIDTQAWEDKKIAGESRFPAQVRVITRKLCSPLEEDSFRPILHHYDGPKFRLELSVPEALALLDVFAE